MGVAAAASEGEGDGASVVAEAAIIHAVVATEGDTGAVAEAMRPIDPKRKSVRCQDVIICR